MTSTTTSRMRFLICGVLLTGAASLAGCGSDTISKTTTTEQTTTSVPRPVTATTTTTTTTKQKSVD